MSTSPGKKSFHWREIERSAPLQFLLDIMKDADRPLTQMEIQKEGERRSGWVANPSTELGEIHMNDGYQTSGGVRFPDGNYRYWLIRAPGWQPRWMIDKDLNQVSYINGREEEYAVPRRTMDERTTDEKSTSSLVGAAVVPRTSCLYCLSPACRRQLPADHQGLPVCGDVCRRVYFDSMQGKLTI